METCNCEATRICVDLYEEDHKKLLHLKVYYGLQIHDMLHQIVSGIYEKVDLYDQTEEAQITPVTVTHRFGERRSIQRLNRLNPVIRMRQLTMYQNTITPTTLVKWRSTRVVPSRNEVAAK